MVVISWILFGLIAGAVAKALHPGKDPGGWMITILIGIAGAVLGGQIGKLLGWGSERIWDFRSFLLSVLGSVIILWIYAKIKGRQ